MRSEHDMFKQPGDPGVMVTYDEHFYEGQRVGSARSASVTIPLVEQFVGRPKSVLDVGCGVGTWLSEWLNSGVEDVVGVDGDYVDRSSLMIPSDSFQACDLTKPLELNRTFDLVTSLEVAEHLPAASARTFVESLTRHSQVVLFSAAVPGQGGAHHVNEQWPSYWAPLFAEFGFTPFDIVRPALWDDTVVEWWYAQNAILYATDGAVKRLGLGKGSTPLDLVHPRMLAIWVEHSDSKLVRRALKASPLGPVIENVRKLLKRQ